MPIDLYVNEGTLTDAAEPVALRRLAQALLHWTDSTGNANVTPNIGAYLHVLKAGRITAGGEPSFVARVDVKLPAIALTTPERRQGFMSDACRIVAECANDPRLVERTWVFLSYAVDGGWGMGGRMFGNDELDALGSL